MKKILTICVICVIIASVFTISCFGVTDGISQNQYYIPFNTVIVRTSGNHEIAFEFPSIYSNGDVAYGGTVYNYYSDCVHQYEQRVNNAEDTTRIEGSFAQTMDENIYQLEFYAPYAIITDEVIDNLILASFDISDTQGFISLTELSFTLTNLEIDQFMQGETRVVDITTQQTPYEYTHYYVEEMPYHINHSLNFLEAYEHAVTQYNTDYAILTDVSYKVQFSPYSEDGKRITFVNYSINEPEIDEIENLTTGIMENIVGSVRVPININDFDFTNFSFIDWISNNMNDLLSIELLPMITIGGILWVVIGLSLLFVVLKVFLGG